MAKNQSTVVTFGEIGLSTESTQVEIIARLTEGNFLPEYLDRAKMFDIAGGKQLLCMVEGNVKLEEYDLIINVLILNADETFHNMYNFSEEMCGGWDA